MPEPNIQQLVHQAQAGDQDSVAALYDALQPRVYRFLVYRVSSVEIAEDLTQTVFLEMIRSLHRYKERSSATFTTWLFQIARHRLIDHYRSNGAPLSIDDVLDPHHPSLVSEQPTVNHDSRYEQVRKRLSQLDPEDRTILHLSYVEDMEPTEIAALLKRTPTHIRVKKHRALRRLRALLNDEL